MAKKTKKKYEEYLNGQDVTFEQVEYLTNPSRAGKTIKPGSLRNLLNDMRYGYIMRKYDPLAFEQGYSEWEGK